MNNSYKAVNIAVVIVGNIAVKELEIRARNGEKRLGKRFKLFNPSNLLHYPQHNPIRLKPLFF